MMQVEQWQVTGHCWHSKMRVTLIFYWNLLDECEPYLILIVSFRLHLEWELINLMVSIDVNVYTFCENLFCWNHT